MSETVAGAALVTGAGRRLGRSIALELAAGGWFVAVHYNTSQGEAGAVVEEIATAGGRAAAVRADLRHEAETESLVERAAEAVGRLTCLVNNASVFERDSVETATRGSWDMHMQVNLRAPFVLTQAFARQVPEGVPANVVNILDQRVWNPTPHFSSYTVSKAGLWTLTQTLALALAPGIRVNAVGPGPTLPSPRQTRDQFDRQWGLMPLRRRTHPEEIGRAVRFILDAPAMTGQMIALDGGQHLGWAQAGGGFSFDE
jgi:NAD(P)-dependent dehydrogenase (short-subunit alcohol dehydrogenase family)